MPDIMSANQSESIVADDLGFLSGSEGNGNGEAAIRSLPPRFRMVEMTTLDLHRNGMSCSPHVGTETA